MKKVLIIILLTSVSTYSQKKSISEIFSEIQTYVEKYEYQPSGKTDLRLNRFSKSIQISNTSIPLNEVEVRYVAMGGQNVVVFECYNCIKSFENGIEKNLAGMGLSFKSKDNCFKMIDMLSDLKDALNRN